MAEIATKGKELIVDISNEPGAAAGVMEILGAAKVNVTAMVGHTSTTAPAGGWFHVLCADPAAAKKVLSKAGYKSKINNVLLLTVSNRPGKMAAVLNVAKEIGVNFDYAYGSASGRAGVAVFATKNLAKAVTAINKMA